MSSGANTLVTILGETPRVAARAITDAYSATVYGSPSKNGRSLRDSDFENLSDEIELFVRSLDGEFVVIVESEKAVLLANDRFAAHPVFYKAHASALNVSFSYQSMWKWLAEADQLKIDRFAFFEFLHFQRLFGETTFDEHSRTLPPATILKFDKTSSAPSDTRYWLPNFHKRTDGRTAVASDLASAVRDSVRVKTSDSVTPSLLLSGGMDSRVALGGFTSGEPPICITVGQSHNNEVDVAKSLAETIGAAHHYVQRSDDHYSSVVSKAVTTGGSMYSFQHGHFFDLDIPPTDLILHGHGFDYFFQGMYLPSTRKRFLGRPTRMYALDSPRADFIKDYIQQAKYRLKGIAPLDLVRAEHRNEIRDRMVSDLEAVLNPIRDRAIEPLDQWDYLTTSAPGRHYTYLNLLSAGSLAEQRTIAFTSDIFDLYYATPASVRHGTALLAETIKHLDPRLLEIRNANTNLRPDLSPARLTINTWTRGLKRRFGVKNRRSTDPSSSDRSWPEDSELATSILSRHERASTLHQSDELGSLDLFDQTKIKSLVDSVKHGNPSGASALLSLVTMDEFLSTR